MDFTLRDAEVADLPVILEIFNREIESGNGAYWGAPVDLKNREVWYFSRKENDMPVLVVQAAGEVVGYGTYGPFRSPPLFCTSVEHSIYVKDGHRGKGYGRAMLEKLMEIGTQRGIHLMIAGIDAGNVESINFHKME